MQDLVYAILALPHIHLLCVFAVHRSYKVIVLSPHQKFLDRWALSNRDQGLYCIFFLPLIVVKLLTHRHLPDRGSFRCELGAESVLLRVEEEVVVFGGVGFIGNPCKVETTELEAFRVGRKQLVYALQELYVNRRGFSDFLSLEAQSSRKRVAEGDEFFLNEEAEAVKSAVERIDDELSECCYLSDSVESMLFLQQHFFSLLQVLYHQVSCLQKLIDIIVQFTNHLEHCFFFGVGSPYSPVKFMQCRQSLKPPAYHFLLALFFLAIWLIVPQINDHNISADLFKICFIVLIPLLIDLGPCTSPQPHAIISMEVGQSRYSSMIPDFDALLKQ